jgi:glycerate 2-kinase
MEIDMRPINPIPYTVLVCPNAYKGSLTAVEAARIIVRGMQRGPRVRNEGGDATIRLAFRAMPLADGGDGTLETLVEATGGTIERLSVRGPLGLPVIAEWGRLGGDQRDTAVIEMAQASGLCLLRPDQYDPLAASTYGTGELMEAAIAAGCSQLLVAIGGSATNDGGAGMAQALGARLTDERGEELPPGGGALCRLANIDLSGWKVPRGTQITVACDVDNPLCGPMGAAAIYGPQKGATPGMIEDLDAALRHYAGILRDTMGIDVEHTPGAGAAGGLGAGLMAFAGGILRPGTDLILDVTGFDAACVGCRLVVTGEGRLDAQTARGKLIAGVTRRAARAGIPVVALVGGIAEGAEEALRSEGLAAALSIVPGPVSVDDAIKNAEPLLEAVAERLARLLTLWF